MIGLSEGERVVEIMLVAEITVSGDEDPARILDEARGACDELPVNLCNYVEPAPQRELREACEAAAHCFNGLVADGDVVLSVLRKLDGGEDLVSEIRSVTRAWTAASQAFLESLTKAEA